MVTTRLVQRMKQGDASMDNVLKLRLIDGKKTETLSNRSNEALMLLCAEDDLQAFTRLVSRNEVPVRRFCFGMLGNWASAEEAAQDTFLKLWMSRKRYRHSDKFRAYLFTIARNRCISLIRRRRVLSFVGLSSASSVAAETRGNDARLDEAERNAILHAAISKLPPKLRAALLLRYIEEMSYDEIAEVVGKNTSTVRSRVHYGLKVLADRLPEEVCTWQS
jgi:RNA polymerase sigma-70 factor, ECF subfamily